MRKPRQFHEVEIDNDGGVIVTVHTYLGDYRDVEPDDLSDLGVPDPEQALYAEDRAERIRTEGEGEDEQIAAARHAIGGMK